MEICQVCKTIIESCDPANLVHKTEKFTVAINPRWSPHLGRVAIFPNRHIGDEGLYGFEALLDQEREEFIELRERITDALVAGFSKYNMRLREGVPHIDYIIRPSPHPSADLFPAYERAPTFAGYVFPSYQEVMFNQGSAPETIQNAPAVLASLSKQELIMPEDLRQKLSSYIKSHFSPAR